jgi:hypothetical protein
MARSNQFDLSRNLIRRGQPLSVIDVDAETCAEMALVGIVPSLESPAEEPIVHRFVMAGRMFEVTGYATREEFLAAVDRAGLSSPHFSAVPAEYNFQKIREIVT